jgi:hypothetical protein
VPQQYSDIINNKVSVVVDINKKKTWNVDIDEISPMCLFHLFIAFI